MRLVVDLRSRSTNGFELQYFLWASVSLTLIRGVGDRSRFINAVRHKSCITKSLNVVEYGVNAHFFEVARRQENDGLMFFVKGREGVFLYLLM